MNFGAGSRGFPRGLQGAAYGISTAAEMTVVQRPPIPWADCVQFSVRTIFPEIFHCSSRWSHYALVS